MDQTVIGRGRGQSNEVQPVGIDPNEPCEEDIAFENARLHFSHELLTLFLYAHQVIRGNGGNLIIL